LLHRIFLPEYPHIVVRLFMDDRLGFFQGSFNVESKEKFRALSVEQSQEKRIPQTPPDKKAI
jgi:hypothetical protein